MELITIETAEQLADYKRELERMEFQYSGAQEQIKKLRAAIAEYENRNDPARIAAGLSEHERSALKWMERSYDIRQNTMSRFIDIGLRTKDGELTSLGLSVLAELQKVKPPVGLKYEVVLLGFGEATNRGFFIDKSSAIFVMEQLKARYKECKYEIREL